MPPHPLAQMFGMPSEEESEYTLPLREAQRDILQGLLAATAERRNFRRGDYVRYLAGAGPLNKKATKGLQLMFWRYLDLNNGTDRLRLKKAQEIPMLPSADCLVVLYNGECIRFDISSSEVLGLDEP